MLDLHLLSAAVDYNGQTAFNPAGSIVSGLVGYIITVLALWPVFTKAGRPGWAAIIPIYNSYTLVKIAGYHGAMTILLFIPIVNIVVWLLIGLGVGRAFGRGTAFSVFLLWLFALIGYFIVGYGRSRYQGDGGRGRF
jgi:hypothetical protein